MAASLAADFHPGRHLKNEVSCSLILTVEVEVDVFWLLHFADCGGCYIGFGFGLKCCVVKLLLFEVLKEKHLIGVRIKWLLG